MEYLNIFGNQGNNGRFSVSFGRLWVKKVPFWLRNDWFSVKFQSKSSYLTEKVPFWLTFNWESSQIDWDLIIFQSFSLGCQSILSGVPVKWLRNAEICYFFEIFSVIFTGFSVKLRKYMTKTCENDWFIWKSPIKRFFSYKISV